MKQGETYHFRLRFGSASTATVKNNGVEFGSSVVRIRGIWITDPEREIEKAAAMAKEAEQVVIYTAPNIHWESEGFHRDDMKLPWQMDRKIGAVLDAKPRAVVVMQSGTPFEMPWLGRVKAPLHAWYGGKGPGNAIADILFGAVNPSIRLSLNWLLRNEHNPAFLNYRSDAGRMLYGDEAMSASYHVTIENEVTYPFGHSLSYSTFTIEDLNVRHNGEELAVSVKVSLPGSREGGHVVQIYVSQEKLRIRRPAKEVKGFGKLFLAKGGSERLTVRIPLNHATSFCDEGRGQWIMEGGL